MSARTDLPPKVVALIDRSFVDRINKVPNSEVTRINRPSSPDSLLLKGKNLVLNKIDNIQVSPNSYSGGNLDNAFEKAPTSADDVLERCFTPRDLSNITKLFERCRDLVRGASVSSDAIWDGLLWIRRGWSTSSFGFDVAYQDRVLQRQLYDQLVLEKKLVKDGPTTAAEHPGCSCWRELTRRPGSSKPIDQEVLHLLIGDGLLPSGPLPGVTPTDQERFDSMHIDYQSPCKSTSVDVCEIDRSLGGAVVHGAQVFLNIGVPISPFSFPDLDAELQAAEKVGLLSPSQSSEAAKLRGEFAKLGRTWACQGYAGEAEAQRRFDKMDEIRNAIQRDAFIRIMQSAASGP
ncbi:MAG: hypothetical protein EOO73_26545 [Myxococcales bacterium]|nr:MAG: hypothetical protein EOO73_26545 [Myxococcales bacterium]